MNYGPINKKCNMMLHGADYNPEQWKDYEGVLDKDIELMDKAHCNIAAMGMFSWSSMEPKEGVFDFSWLDEVMDRLAKGNKFAILSTPSGARPVWMAQKYQEVLRVSESRVRNLYGFRHNHCYTSPVYREKIGIINKALAMRYKNHPALLVWHISNEYGGECHCELCQEAFRSWLKVKYDNSLEKLNNAWWTKFWSHTYTDWSQIESPSSIGEIRLHGLNLDWKRFVTYQTTDFMKAEIVPIRAITPNTPITTNFMGIYDGLDYSKMAKEVDVISWNSYPAWHSDIKDSDMGASVGFVHDLNRAFKQGKPFMLMESTPSQTSFMPVNKLKRPGMLMLSSIQAVAHGSDTVQYFQWRKSKGSFEKYHGAVVDHSGHEDTRVFKEVAEVGEILSRLNDVVGTSVTPEAAVIYDWENKWAYENIDGFNNKEKKYAETVITHYKAFWKMGIPVDVIDMEQDISKYKVVVAPILYMLKKGTAQRIEKFVKDGGVFVTTYMSAMADESDLCFLGGFPGPLREVLGIWVEDTDALYEGQVNKISVKLNKKTSLYDAVDICSLIHCEAAQKLGEYEKDFYKGYPALTVNDYGKGQAYYIAFRNNDNFEQDFYAYLSDKLILKCAIDAELPEGVTAQTRYDEKSRFVFIMNFNENEQKVKLNTAEKYTDIITGEKTGKKIKILEYGVRILKAD